MLITHLINIFNNRFEFRMAFPEDLGIDFNNKTLKYKLHTVIVHVGNTGGGHYYSFIKSFEEKQWRKFNDQSVTLVSV